ncbi:MAG: hypothetical protein ACYTF1_08465 [Planctomycetota bacterium]
MRGLIDNQQNCRDPAAWAKFAVSILLLAGVVLLLMQGYTPPGPAGVVFRNNLRNGIDATPIFYTEVESLAPDE